MPRPFVISMYSFKGGAGRTVCTANLAPRLAAALETTSEMPLLMLDLDLDSSGLTILLSEGIPSDTTWDTTSLLNNKFNLGSDRQAEMFRREGMIDVTGEMAMRDRQGAVRLVAGPKIDAQQSSDLNGKVAQESFDSLLDFAEIQGIPAVLIDSASGLQQTAILSHRVSDVVVYCCRLTYQFMMGTEHHLKLLMDECKRASYRAPARPLPRILIVPVAVPEVTPQWKPAYTFSLNKLRGLRNKLGNPNLEVIEPPIPEVDSFKWKESVLDSHSEDLSPDEQRAADAFDALAARILKCNPNRCATEVK